MGKRKNTIVKEAELTKADYKHNEKMLIADGVGWWAGAELFSAGSIVSVFIYTLTGSVTLSGLATTVQTGGMMLGQLLAGPKVSKIIHGGKSSSKYSLISRSILFLAVLSILLPLSPMAIATIFLCLYFVSWLFHGAVGLVFKDMFPRVVRNDSYGRIQGLRGTLGYVMAFVSGLLVKWILSSPDIVFKSKYIMIMSLGIAFSLTCVFALFNIRDVGPKNRVISHTIKDMIADIPAKIRLPKCKAFRKFMVVRIFAFFSDAMLPFMLVFAAKNGVLTVAQIATLVFMKIIGALISAYIGGKLIDKVGAHIVLFIHSIIRLIMAVTCIFLIFNPHVGFGVYIFIVILTGTGMQGIIGYNIYMMVITPDEIRPDMLLINAMIGLPFAILAFIIGRVADSIGFLPLFIIMCIFSIITAILSRILLLNKKQQLTLFNTK